MYCSNCGKQISNDDAFCPSCGARTAPFQPSVTVVRDNVAQPMSQPTYTPPVAQPTYAQPTYAQPVHTAAPAAEKSNTVGIVGFILAFLMPIPGLICSIIGYRNAKNGLADNKGLALAGVIISAVELASALIASFMYVFVYVIFFIGFAAFAPYYSATLLALLGGLLI